MIAVHHALVAASPAVAVDPAVAVAEAPDPAADVHASDKNSLQ